MTKQNKSCCSKDHPDNSKELPRLKKIAGQINGIQKMIEDKRYCVEILQQLGAVKSAINSLQANLLETHLTNCVKEAFELKKDADIEEKIMELKEIFKKY
jgi:CsoR family transcriptional regulator, copper-sensing transcriptional repressor